MRASRKRSSPAIDNAVNQGVSYELSLADRARRSERRAWMVAGCAVVMSLVLASGYFLFLPLKEKVPYLVMADPYTGTATVARLVGNFNDRTITSEEAVNKSNVAQFVLAREAYDSGLIGQRNWRTTLSMAGPAVAPAYMRLFSEANPERPPRLFGATRSVRVRILSIVLTGGGQAGRPRGATVRFQRSVFDKTSGRHTPLDSKIATMEFTYNPELRLSEEDRLLNPLGFRVVNYRVDDDFAAAPVPEREFPVEPVDAPEPATAAVEPGLAATGMDAAETAVPQAQTEQQDGEQP